MSANTAWLQYSKLDLAGGLGGVEVHARSLDRELKVLGIDSKISNDPRDLENPRWTVVHTHGSSPLKHAEWRLTRAHRPTLVHTLHGTTLGRMAACGEWTWPGGYAAAARELRGVSRADVVLAVHEDLWLYHWAKMSGKKTAVCSNGYDSAVAPEPLPEGTRGMMSAVGEFFVFVGRGSDPVKGAAIFSKAIRKSPSLRGVAAPGEGFGDEVVHSGRLTPAQVQTLMKQSRGLVVSSYYEGLPLVILEALSHGVPVIASNVGGIKTFSAELRGLMRIKPGSVSALTAAMKMPPVAPSDGGKTNREMLLTWNQVAKRALDACR